MGVVEGESPVVVAVDAAVVGVPVEDVVPVVAVVADVPPVAVVDAAVDVVDAVLAVVDVVDAVLAVVAASTTGAVPPVALLVAPCVAVPVTVVPGTVELAVDAGFEEDEGVTASGETVTDVRLDVPMARIHGPRIVDRCVTWASHSSAGDCGRAKFEVSVRAEVSMPEWSQGAVLEVALVEPTPVWVHGLVNEDALTVCG